MIYHFLLALILAVIVMPKSAMSLNELNELLNEKLDEEPVFMIETEGKRFELDQDEREIIKSRWIDEVELLNESYTTEEHQTSTKKIVIKVILKKRKVDDFWQEVEKNKLQL